MPVTIGAGTGVAEATTESDQAILTANGTGIPLTAAGISTDHDRIELSGTVPASLAESEAMRPLRESGDVERITTAFGAFRRVRRDGGTIERIVPPAALDPPFRPRDGVIEDFALDPVSPVRYEWSATVGLEEPRPRDPIDVGDQGEPVDFAEQSVSVAGGTTTSITLSETVTVGAGDFLATVSSPTDSDQTLVTVTRTGAVTLSFPGAALVLDDRQVGQVQRAQSRGIETLQVPLRLTPAQAAKLFAVGSRVEGAALRAADGAQNFARDTVPGEELTASVSAPLGLPIRGERLLRSWSASVETVTGDFPVDAEVELAFVDRGDLTIRAHPDLVVSTDQVIETDESRRHSTVVVESGATLTVNGSLKTASLTVNGSVDVTGSVDLIDAYVTRTDTIPAVDTLTLAAGNALIIDGGSIQARSVDINGGPLRLINGAELLIDSDTT